MSNEEIELLLKSLGERIVGDNKAGNVLDMLIQETVKFRDKLEKESGVTLTVADTRLALEALEKYLHSEPWEQYLTSEQATLLQIWIDRITLFNK